MTTHDLIFYAVIFLVGGGLLFGCYVHDKLTEKKNVQRRDPWRESIETRTRMRARKRETVRQILQVAQQHRR